MNRGRAFFVALALIVSAGLADVAGQPSRPVADTSYDRYVAEARALTAKGRAAEAIVTAEKAIRLNDRRWEGFVAAAGGYAAQGLLDDAIGMLQLALARAPENRKQTIRDVIVESRKQMLAAARGGPSGGPSPTRAPAPAPAPAPPRDATPAPANRAPAAAPGPSAPAPSTPAPAAPAPAAPVPPREAPATPATTVAGTTWKGEVFDSQSTDGRYQRITLALFSMSLRAGNRATVTINGQSVEAPWEETARNFTVHVPAIGGACPIDIGAVTPTGLTLAGSVVRRGAQCKWFDQAEHENVVLWRGERVP